MNWTNLRRIGEAPSSGICLAYTRKRVIFEPYASVSDVMTSLEGEELLELHLFHDNREYRCIVSESSRFPSHVIEAVSDFPENPGKDMEYAVFPEQVQLEEKYCKQGIGSSITVLNKISFDEHGLGAVSDYRLRIGGRTDGE